MGITHIDERAVRCNIPIFLPLGRNIEPVRGLRRIPGVVAIHHNVQVVHVDAVVRQQRQPERTDRFYDGFHQAGSLGRRDRGLCAMVDPEIKFTQFHIQRVSGKDAATGNFGITNRAHAIPLSSPRIAKFLRRGDFDPIRWAQKTRACSRKACSERNSHR